ncbi:MAG: pentapeptide repeat-containing protein [Thermomicrobiales bacterium]
MDPLRFDRLATTLSRSANRRATLGVLLTGLIAAIPVIDGAASRRNARARRRRGRQERQQDSHGHERNSGHSTLIAIPASCCASSSCMPGAGRNLTGCCFRGHDLDGTNFRAANLTDANFGGAILTNADFRGANLTRLCLVDADIRGATFGGSNLQTAIRCRTRTESGSDDSGCAQGTACCPTDLGSPLACSGPQDCADQVCMTKSCLDGECEYSVAISGSNPNDLCGTTCCGGECCPNATVCNDLGGCCAPSCGSKVCGPNGCGGSCGSCPQGTACDDNGECQPTCSSENCPFGCCTPDGVCAAGDTVQTCGTGGAACSVCGGTQTCEKQQCLACGTDCLCAGQSACTNPFDGNVFCTGDCTCVVSVEGEPFCARSYDISSVCTSSHDCQSLEQGSVCAATGSAPGGTCPNHAFCALACRG